LSAQDTLRRDGQQRRLLADCVEELRKVAKADRGELNVGTISVGSTQNLGAELCVRCRAPFAPFGIGHLSALADATESSDSLRYRSSREISARLKADISKWTKMIEDAKIATS
jgi:hypothetical protein